MSVLGIFLCTSAFPALLEDTLQKVKALSWVQADIHDLGVQVIESKLKNKKFDCVSLCVFFWACVCVPLCAHVAVVVGPCQRLVEENPFLFSTHT